MRIEDTDLRMSGLSFKDKLKEGDYGGFEDALLKFSAIKSRVEDSYEKSEQESPYQYNNYNHLNRVINTIRSDYINSIKPVETERYKIEYDKTGKYLSIYDKERDEKFGWNMDRTQIQVDGQTGIKVLINDFGSNIFMMMAVDSELEAALKESLGVEKLPEKALQGYTVHQDKNTGIRYITPNGYESYGGAIIFEEGTSEILDSLAKEFLQQYPNLARTYNEGWFYASFEVRGMLKRTPNGIMMLFPNSIAFRDKDGIHGWRYAFNPEDWEKIKEAYDNGSIGEMEEWEFWDKFFKDKNIDAHLVTPDGDKGDTDGKEAWGFQPESLYQAFFK